MSELDVYVLNHKGATDINNATKIAVQNGQMLVELSLENIDKKVRETSLEKLIQFKHSIENVFRYLQHHGVKFQAFDTTIDVSPTRIKFDITLEQLLNYDNDAKVFTITCNYDIERAKLSYNELYAELETFVREYTTFCVYAYDENEELFRRNSGFPETFHRDEDFPRNALMFQIAKDNTGVQSPVVDISAWLYDSLISLVVDLNKFVDFGLDCNINPGWAITFEQGFDHLANIVVDFDNSEFFFVYWVRNNIHDYSVIAINADEVMGVLKSIQFSMKSLQTDAQGR